MGFAERQPNLAEPVAARPGRERRGDNYWGSWCAPCRAEAPHLESTYKATRSLGVRFLGIAIRDTRETATAFQASFGITYPSVFDPAGRVALAFRDVPPRSVPATIVLDRRLRITAVFRKPLLREDLEPTVARQPPTAPHHSHGCSACSPGHRCPMHDDTHQRRRAHRPLGVAYRGSVDRTLRRDFGSDQATSRRLVATVPAVAAAAA